jgi:hypothetical protein
LSDKERAKKIRDLQEQQERILLWVLSDELFEWPQDLRWDSDILSRNNHIFVENPAKTLVPEHENRLF